MSKPADELIAELEALEDVQQRIDRVAEDFAKSENKYCVIGAWQLGELLGLDFHDTADWSQSSWAYRHELEDDIGFDYPFAENVGLLQGKISASHYQGLATLAEEIITTRPGRDLPLTKEEQVLLRNAYAKAQADFPDLGVASTTLTASSGVELDFEVCIGDAGEPQDPQSPYDLRNGKGFDSSNYIEVNSLSIARAIDHSCVLGLYLPLRLLKRCALRFITRGAHGSLLVSEDKTIQHGGFGVKVADAIGSGDAFTASLAHHYLRGESLEEISKSANRFASWVATQVGATPLIQEPRIY